MPQLFAGVARCDITPPVGIAHGNWSAQVHERAQGIDLPLWCTVLAATDGNEAILLAEWDLLYPPADEWLVNARRRIAELSGVPADHIRLSASHTHSGPNVSPPWFEQGAEMIGPYVASLTDRLAGTCLAAWQNLEPARVAGGAGTSDVNCNRRFPWQPGRPMMAPNPDGYSDHQVGVIRIDRAAGTPLAVLVNFAAHPTILSWDNQLISPDYPGALRRTVESLTGATCLFLQGAAGNQDTVRDYSCQTSDARWVGRQLGMEAARVAEALETRTGARQIVRQVESSWTMGVSDWVSESEPDGSVRCLSRQVALPVWPHAPPTEAERALLQAQKAQLASLRAQGAPVEEVRLANRQVRRASLDLWINKRRSRLSSIELEFQAIRLGQVALVGIPVEPFAEIGAQVKAASPFATTFFSGYTNGVEAYMPVASAYAEGGYEVWMSPFTPEAAAMTVAASLDLLGDLAR